MSEDCVCMLGRVPKVLSYVRNGQYIHTICKLSDNVDSIMLNDFFNMIYSFYFEKYEKKYLEVREKIVDLVNFFCLVLKEDTVINMKDLCFLVKDLDNNHSYFLLDFIKSFFEMFEVIDERIVSLENYNDIKSITVNSNDLFYKEVESIFYNSEVIDFFYDKNRVKVKNKSLSK